MAKLGQSGDVNMVVYILVILFGTGSWVAVNGLWVELPLLVQDLPESWNLPSFLVIIIQIANIGPLVYCLLKKCCRHLVSDRVCIYVLVLIGSAACMLLAFLWRRTLIIADNSHSVALFILAFFLATVDCTSSVVFLPWMSRLKAQYLTAFFIGEGLSGLIPSLVALAQGASGTDECVNKTIVNTTTGTNVTILVPLITPPNFSVDVFFIFLFLMMVVCGVSFLLLNYLPLCQKEHVKHSDGVSSSSSTESADDPRTVVYRTVTEEEGNGRVQLDNVTTNSQEPLQYRVTGLTEPAFIYLLVLTGWVNCMSNGLLPSIQSYSALPYGHSAYHLAVTLSSLVNPLTCFLLFLLPCASKRVVSSLSLIGTVFLVYIYYLASRSPAPPMVDTAIGQILMVSVWIVNTAVLSGVKVVVATIIRPRGQSALFWYGVSEQVGSLIGATVSFIMVNLLQLFTAKYPCT